MPFIATNKEYRRKGMCKKLMVAIETVRMSSHFYTIGTFLIIEVTNLIVNERLPIVIFNMT
uniref:Uncharacterized protein n=1 Tax=Solanum tuberosum TaxID=4113 RepID=M1CHG1_SOLTU